MIERRSVPHMTDHYVERKRAIEAALRESGDVRRLVVLGAGFDTLAARWVAEDDERCAVEIDHPATQTWKRRALAGCELEAAGMNFRALDLSQAGELSLGEGERQTFWVAEGLLMYFDEPGVAAIFEAIRRASQPESWVAFTFLEPGADGRVGFRLPSRALDRWLAGRRESFRWGIRRADVAEFLERLGFRQIEVPGALTRELDELEVGEYLALAEVR